jgi:hypothetical protein
MHDDRVHARMAVIRDLFGLTVEEGVPAAEELAAASDADAADAVEGAGSDRVVALPTRARGRRRG